MKMTSHRVLHLTIPVPALLLVALLLLAAACTRQDGESKDDFYTALSDRIQETGATHPDDNFDFIDSLEREKVVPPCVADYFRANAHYPLQQYRAVEFYSKKALSDGSLHREWPSAYYICSRNLANNLQAKGDHEGALTYAMAAYEKAQDDPLPDAKLNAPGLLLFISISQYALGKTAESELHVEQAYRQSLEYTQVDTSFNAYYHFVVNTLSVLTTMGSNYTAEQAQRWISRAEEAAAMLERVADREEVSQMDRELTHTTAAIISYSKARVLAQIGRQQQADEAFRDFMATSHAQTPNGIVSQYNYYYAAEKWPEAMALMPQVDSIKARRGHLLTLENLKTLHSQYTIYQKAGRHDKAVETARYLIENIDTVVRRQHQSVADELAVIFETRQQDRKIAEQQLVISHQRMLAFAIVMLLCVLFFVLFTLHNRKAAKKALRENKKLQKAYQKLTEANERAEVSSKMKTAFIQQISHEIRTPLNILSGFAQIVTADYRLDDATRKDASMRIMENTKRITEVVNQMLELSEASTETAVENLTDMPLADILHKAIDETQIEHAPNVSFRLDADETTKATLLHTHQRRAARALSLLLDNARKFTPKGEVTLTATPTPDGRMMAIAVEDNGIGVPPKEAEHIFEEFVQLDEYSEGTGIGLTVARSFARRLGGDVVLDTAHTPGARFILTLPITKKEKA